MQNLVFGTNAGSVYIYDLPKALENERLLNKKKLEMGVEEELVLTFLERATLNEVQEYLNNN